MESGYRKRLFDTYNLTHSSYINHNEQQIYRWSKRYIAHNYLSKMSNYDSESARILEIGCGRGYFLAGLQTFGYKKKLGVDLSPGDVEKAKVFAPGNGFLCQD